MPYLRCPRCRRTAWVRSGAEDAVDCRTCGTTLSTLGADDARLLASAVRERFARDARAGAGRPRFVRGPR